MNENKEISFEKYVKDHEDLYDSYIELLEKYDKLLNFLKERMEPEPCLFECNCFDCDARKLLKELGELNG